MAALTLRAQDLAPMADVEDLRRAVRRYVEEARRALNTDLTGLARAARLAPSTLTRFVNSADADHVLSARTLAAIARAANVPVPPEVMSPALRFGPDSNVGPYPAAFSPGILPRDVPVYGAARGDNDGRGDFMWNGETVGHVKRPAGLSGARNAFALYVQGDSMSPWRQPGSLVYVNPHQPPRIGDHVVVEMKPAREGEPGTAWLKQLVARASDGALTLRQYNPLNDRIRVRAAEILRVYRVMEWEELLEI